MISILSVLLGAILGYGFESFRRAGDRRREVQSLRAALVAEASTITSLIKRAGYVQDVERTIKRCEVAAPGEKVGGFLIHLTENYLAVFEANAGQLGILPSEEVRAFVRFHLLTKTLIDSFKPGAPLTLGEHDAEDLARSLRYALSAFEELNRVSDYITSLDPSGHATIEG